MFYYAPLSRDAALQQMPPLRPLINKLTSRQQLSHHEILIIAISTLAALALIVLISKQLLSGLALPFVVASMGASAILMFAAPSSPMSHPWAVAAGHFVSATVGVVCLNSFGTPLIAAPIAVTLSILLMLYLRCLHPPAGATAMLIALGGEQIRAAGYQIILTPIVLNIVILLCAAAMIHHITRQQRQRIHRAKTIQWINELEAGRPLAPRLALDDVVAARTQLDTYIDVEDEALLQLMRLAVHNTHQRRLGGLCCRDLMLPEPISAEFGSHLDEVWELFQQHHLTAVPVIDRARRVIGIVTLNDFIHHAAHFPQATLEERIKALVRRSEGPTSDKAEVAGQIMTSPAITAREESRVAELLPLLDNGHIHHVPVVNAQNRLTGLLNRSEIVTILEQEESTL